MTLRRALLVGINAYPVSPLRGCLNDVAQMHDLLAQGYGFSEADIRVLTDGEATLGGIKDGLAWLATGGAEPDAVRVFYFSGHGSQVADWNGDEPDGRDECLVPFDYTTVGMLTDDILKAIYDQFPKNGNLTLVMDCCHSGTIQRAIAEDLVFRFIPMSAAERQACDAAAAKFAEAQRVYVVDMMRRMRGEELSEDAMQDRALKLMARFEKKRFGDVRVREGNVLLAGCRADQSAADALIEGDYHGAFTHALAKAVLESPTQLSYRDLMDQATDKLMAGHFDQVPQLEYESQRDRQMAFLPFV